ncbi:MAG TPA: hypothetical protein VIL26_04005 [Clostridia bacterium]
MGENIKCNIKKGVDIRCSVTQRDEVSVALDKDITVSDDYPRLTNKPKINGIELNGDKAAKELNLLSSRLGDYVQVDLADVIDGSYLLVLSSADNAEKIALKEITEGRVKTAEVMPTDLQIGNYVFLLKGEI